MKNISNIPQKYFNAFYILFTLLVYNTIILVRYSLSGNLTKNYIMAQYAFTYQKVGFVSRGIIPSSFYFLEINRPISYYILFNIVMILYVVSVIYISKIFLNENRNYFIISFSFLFFDIPHFALDAFRLDSIFMLMSLWVFITLYFRKLKIAFIISVLALFVHEAVIFILFPIYLLMMSKDNKKHFTVTLIFYLLVFGIIITFSEDTTKRYAIHLIHKFIKIRKVADELYALNTLENKTTFFEMFRTYNISLFILYGIAYLAIIYFTFIQLIKNNFSIQKLFFLFPLMLCFIGVDYYRWYCFVFFLVMLYQIYYLKTFDKKIFRNLFYTTILFGIPMSLEIKFGILQFILHSVLKII